MYKKLTYSLINGCSFIHILCCRLPLLGSLIGFRTLVGITANGPRSSFFLSGTFEIFEVIFIGFAGLLLMLSFAIKLKAKYPDCCDSRENNLCSQSNNVSAFF